MKFYSKFSNHRIVLKPGIPGEPLLGRAPQPGVYVKFEDGVADVKDQDVIDMLLNNRNFGKTFVAEENSGGGDPYQANRRDAEPEHDVTEIKYGRVAGNLNPKPKLTMSREQKAIVTEMAKEMAKSMAPELAKEMLLEMAAERKAAESEEAKQEVADKKPATEKAPATKAKK